jgi:CHAT domain-containing protein
VLAALPEAAIAHFACHASSDPADASASRLLLHDGPLDIIEISQLELGHAELAYLSACATARGSIGLADEAIHIASAFQLAGYAQVVGTLWEIGDRMAARVAAEFHRELAGTVHDPVRPAGAHALHAVIRRLRAELPTQPWVWAAYLHAGA